MSWLVMCNICIIYVWCILWYDICIFYNVAYICLYMYTGIGSLMSALTRPLGSATYSGPTDKMRQTAARLISTPSGFRTFITQGIYMVYSVYDSFLHVVYTYILLTVLFIKYIYIICRFYLRIYWLAVYIDLCYMFYVKIYTCILVWHIDINISYTIYYMYNV